MNLDKNCWNSQTLEGKDNGKTWKDQNDQDKKEGRVVISKILIGWKDFHPIMIGGEELRWISNKIIGLWMNKMDSFQVSLTSRRFGIIDWRKG